MTVLFPRAGLSPDDLAAAARRLADDLAFLAAGRAPDPGALADAPVLDLWRPARRPAVALLGFAGAKRTVRLTTELFAIDSDAQWARTFSRWYALGRPVGVDLGRRQ